MTRRQLTNIGIIVLLVLAIPIGIYLAQQTQIFRSRAANDPVEFSGPNIITNQDGDEVLQPVSVNSDGTPVYKVDLILTAPVSPLPQE